MNTNRYAKAHPEHPVIPRPALYAAGGLMALALIGSGIGAAFKDDTPRIAKIQPEHSATLTFVEREDNSIDVFEPNGGPLFTTLSFEENGFVRGILRAVGHVRRTKRMPIEGPLELIEDKAGAVSVYDPSTGRLFALRGHGEKNYRAFAQLLSLKKESGT